MEPAAPLAFTDDWSPGPANPVLAADEVHVWRIPLQATDDEHLAVLAPSERARAARFLRPRDGRQYGLTRAAVRGILARYLDVAPEAVAFTTARSGKPSVLTPSGSIAPRYNSSHSGRVALCAVAHVDVGIDLEWMREAPIAAGIAAGIVSEHGPVRPDEPPSLERDWAFFRAWTRTEAALKATGEGLSAIDRRSPAIIRALAELHPEQYRAGLRIVDLPIGVHNVGALALVGGESIRVVRCWTWDRES
jgi:4'-phosphopantetheinyl transferase